LINPSTVCSGSSGQARMQAEHLMHTGRIDQWMQRRRLGESRGFRVLPGVEIALLDGATPTHVPGRCPIGSP
jgi:hypothetical protein